ncbi:MAG: hypothetical protein AB1714_17380 [Acidobacteriota bacterium]
MNKSLSGLCCMLLVACAFAAHAAENYYVPLIRGQADDTCDLYWMKLNQDGKLVRAIRLIRDSAGKIESAAIVPQGNKMLYTERQLGNDFSQIYSLGLNPKNGKVTSGPVALTSGSTYWHYGVSTSQDGRKFVYQRYPVSPWGDAEMLLRKFKKNGVLAPRAVPIPSASESGWPPVITEDGKYVYYGVRGGDDNIYVQALNANGTPTGAPQIALSGPPCGYPWLARIDAGRAWMSYVCFGPPNPDTVYLTRLSPSGQATGTPVKLVDPAPGTFVYGGITRNPRILIYTLDQTTTWTVYSQKLDANGNPVGAPIVLSPATDRTQAAWIVPIG